MDLQQNLHVEGKISSNKTVEALNTTIFNDTGNNNNVVISIKNNINLINNVDIITNISNIIGIPIKISKKGDFGDFTTMTIKINNLIAIPCRRRLSNNTVSETMGFNILKDSDVFTAIYNGTYFLVEGEPFLLFANDHVLDDHVDNLNDNALHLKKSGANFLHPDNKISATNDYVDNKISTVNTNVATKSPTNHASTATTYGVSTNANYGHSKAGTLSPAMNGIASAGTANGIFANENHVHPSDTAKANLNSPNLIGIPTAPTASITTNTDQIATTKFVNSSLTDLGNKVIIKGSGTAYTPTADTDPANLASVKNQILLHKNELLKRGFGGINAENPDPVLKDWNNVKETGFYMASGYKNSPPQFPYVGNDWYYIEVQKHNNMYCTQRATSFYTNRVAQRILSETTWLPWEEIAIASDYKSFTPHYYGNTVAGSPVYATNYGNYKTMGNICFIAIETNFNSTGGMSGAIIIKGLPRVAVGPQQVYAMNVYGCGLNGRNQAFVRRGNGAIELSLDSSNSPTWTSISNIQTKAELYITGFYVF